MKTLMLLVTSSLVIAASGALAQGNADACHNQYGSCMARCSSRPQSVQDTCSQSCEMSTNQCYGKMYGSPSPTMGSASKEQAPQPETSEASEGTAPAGAPREAKRAQGSETGKKAESPPPRMLRAPNAQVPEWPAPLLPAPPVAQVPQTGTPN